MLAAARHSLFAVEGECLWDAELQSVDGDFLGSLLGRFLAVAGCDCISNARL